MLKSKNLFNQVVIALFYILASASYYICGSLLVQNDKITTDKNEAIFISFFMAIISLLVFKFIIFLLDKFIAKKKTDVDKESLGQDNEKMGLLLGSLFLLKAVFTMFSLTNSISNLISIVVVLIACWIYYKQENKNQMFNKYLFGAKGLLLLLFTI